ncbi:MAG: hypothetical protein WCO66_01275 [Candidatus Absconditabacteria bacterium]
MNIKDHNQYTFKDDHGMLSNYQNIKYKHVPTAKALIYNNLCSSNQDIPHKKDDLSELDLYNMIDLGKVDALFLIKNFFKKSDKSKHFINGHIHNKTEKEFITPEGIEYMNKTIQEAMLFYKNTLKRDIEIGFFEQRGKGEDKKILFENTQDVINFLRANSTRGGSVGNRQIICSLMKIAHCINIKNQKEKELKRREIIFDQISERHIYPHFLNKKNNEIDGEQMRGKIQIGEKGKYKTFGTKEKKPITFRGSARIKDDDMIILKMLSNPDYNDISAINDIYGKRNECENKDDALLLLQYHWINVYKKDIKTELKIKNLFGKTPQETEIYINSMKEKLNPEFFVFLSNASHKRHDGKNNEEYEDAKLIGPLTDDEGKKHSVEIQFNLMNNKNEEHFSHHRIYKMKAIIEAIVRLQGYIRRTHAERLIHLMLQEHKEIIQSEEPGKFPELFYLGGNTDPDNSEPAEKAIYEHFVEEGVILPLKFPDGGTRRTCTSKKSRNRFHKKEENESMYPNGAEIYWKDTWHKGKID